MGDGGAATAAPGRAEDHPVGVRRRSWSGVTGSRPGEPVEISAFVRALPDVVAAERLAAVLLAGSPERLRHLRTAAAVALTASETVAPDRLEVLLSATVLHDIGYADVVRSTGFHPLDGAEWLRAHGAPADVAGVVAHHSEAVLLPGADAYLTRLGRLPRPEPTLADVVTYADQTTTPDGRRTALLDRLRERRLRRPATGPAACETQRRRAERLVHAVTRVTARLDRIGAADVSLHAVDPYLAPSRPLPDDEVVAQVLEAVPLLGAADGLDRAERVRAAVHAARLLLAADCDPAWDDLIATACRLLGRDAPSVPGSLAEPPRVTLRR